MMQSGQSDSGMVTMNQSLAKLVEKQIITKREAMAFTSVPDELAKMLGYTA